MKKLPIGIQSFEEIRSGDYYYVDKTHFVCKLAEEGKYYFLSRPRRFGKSLFLDTLKQAFLGKKELFEGLYLFDNWEWGKVYPVVHIDFSEGVVESAEHLKKVILSKILKNASFHGINLKEELLERKLIELIEALRYRSGSKVVVLIDEYDKPILDKIEEPEEAKRIREVLKNLYSVLKPLDRYLKFVFITGVSKFSKVSLFSGLNQLQDITLSPRYATICGYTQEELEKVFSEEIRGEDLSAIRCWYNGYSFCGETLYNPFDVLLYLSERQFRPYWFETGTPTFLVRLLFEKKFYLPECEDLIATERLLGSFDVDFIEPENLLFQAGYLTIKNYEPSLKGLVYYLGYPNKEVKISLNEYLVAYYTQQPGEVERLGGKVIKQLKRGEVKSLEGIFRSLFSGIPYEWHKRADLSGYEGYYASVVYSFFLGTGVDVVAEDYTSKGRIDLTILLDERAYLFEFKVVEREGEIPKALEALKGRGYVEKYRGKYREIYLIGMDFSAKERNLVCFEWERVIAGAL